MEAGDKVYICYTLMVSVNNYPKSHLLVIGGTSSLGQALIIQAKKQGSLVTSTYRSKDKISISDINWEELCIDRLESIDLFLSKISNYQFSTIVYCIGSLSNLKLKSVSSQQISNYLETNVLNAAYLITKLAKRFQEGTSSKLVYISSRSALYPSFDFIYAASKAALSSLVSSLSRQIPENNSTYVFAPGLVKGSTIYNNMNHLIREDHERRSNHKLFDVQEVASFIVNFNYSTTPSGSIIEVGPSYK
jgi:short-subunit dehydrogenase